MKLKTINTPRPTQDMLVNFYRRTNEHIRRVANNLHVFVDYYATKDKPLSVELQLRAYTHDISKLCEPEVEGYIWITEKHRSKMYGDEFNPPPEIIDLMDKATEHHVKNNRHHPESHIDVNKMNDIDLIEMVCDWTAMAEELKQNDGDPTTWARNNMSKRWNFNENNVKKIFGYISLLMELKNDSQR